MLQLTFFLQECKAQFFHSVLNPKCSTCKRVGLWEVGGFASCITVPIFRKFWKMLSFLINLVFQTDFSQQLHIWVQSKFQMKALLLYRWIRLKNHRFWSMHQNHVYLKFQKVDMKNDSSGISKCYFSVTTSLISSKGFTIGNLTLGEKKSIEISVSWFFASKSGHSKQRKFFYWLMSKFDFVFLYSYKPNFFQQGLNRKLEAFAVIFN